MFSRVKTYDPASGVPPVEGQDYRILSKGAVQLRAVRHFAVAAGFGLVSSFGLGVGSTPFVALALKISGEPYEPDIPKGAILLAVGGYAFQRAHDHKRLYSRWSNAASTMSVRGHSHTVWVNPCLCKGDTPDADVGTLFRRAMQLRGSGSIPGVSWQTHGLLMGGYEDLRL